MCFGNIFLADFHSGPIHENAGDLKGSQARGWFKGTWLRFDLSPCLGQKDGVRLLRHFLGCRGMSSQKLDKAAVHGWDWPQKLRLFRDPLWGEMIWMLYKLFYMNLPSIFSHLLLAELGRINTNTFCVASWLQHTDRFLFNSSSSFSFGFSLLSMLLKPTWRWNLFPDLHQTFICCQKPPRVECSVPLPPFICGQPVQEIQQLPIVFLKALPSSLQVHAATSSLEKKCLWKLCDPGRTSSPNILGGY